MLKNYEISYGSEKKEETNLRSEGEQKQDKPKRYCKRYAAHKITKPNNFGWRNIAHKWNTIKSIAASTQCDEYRCAYVDRYVFLLVNHRSMSKKKRWREIRNKIRSTKVWHVGANKQRFCHTVRNETTATRDCPGMYRSLCFLWYTLRFSSVLL